MQYLNFTVTQSHTLANNFAQLRVCMHFYNFFILDEYSPYIEHFVVYGKNELMLVRFLLFVLTYSKRLNMLQYHVNQSLTALLSDILCRYVTMVNFQSSYFSVIFLDDIYNLISSVSHVVLRFITWVLSVVWTCHVINNTADCNLPEICHRNIPCGILCMTQFLMQVDGLPQLI